MKLNVFQGNYKTDFLLLVWVDSEARKDLVTSFLHAGTYCDLDESS